MALSNTIANVLVATGWLPASPSLTDAQVLTAQALMEEERLRQTEILLVRRYHDGKHDVFLNERLAQWLASDSTSRKPTFSLNLVRKVTENIVEKLRFEGVDAAKIVLDKDAFVRDMLKQHELAQERRAVQAQNAAPPPPAPPPNGSGSPTPPTAPLTPPPAPEPMPVEPPSEDMIEAKRQLAWAGYWMTEANLAMAVDDGFEMAVRDGEAFLFVFPNEKRGMFPKIIAQPRFVDPGVYDGDGDNRVSGDGYGCIAHYPHGDTRLDPEFVSKRWIEYPETGVTRQRENLYFPDRIEFWYRDTGMSEWTPFPDPENDNQTELAWVDNGQPIGIPIVHLKKSDLRPQAWDAIPVQDAINKVVLDLLATADLTAFQIIITRGWFPTKDGNVPDEDGSNLLEIAPGHAIGTGAKANETATDVIKAAELTPLIELLRTLIIYLAVLCNLPSSRYNFSGNLASEQTLKEQDEPLLSLVRRLQKPFGDAMEEVFTVARKLANVYGGMGFDEEVSFRAMWGKSETRSTMDLLQELAIKREKLHLPFQQLWIEAGYTEAQVEQFMQVPEIRAFLDQLEQGITNALQGGGNNFQNRHQVKGGAPGQGRSAAQDQTVNNLRNRENLRASRG